MQFFYWKTDGSSVRLINKKFKQAYDMHLINLTQLVQTQLYNNYSMDQIKEGEEKILKVYREFACKGSAEQDPKHGVCLTWLKDNLSGEIQAFAEERKTQSSSVPVKDLLIDKAFASIQYIFGEFRELRLWP